MSRFVVVLVLVSLGFVWLMNQVMQQPGITLITWGLSSIRMKTATLILYVLLACVMFYLAFTLLLQLTGIGKKVQHFRSRRAYNKAKRSLNQGLIQLTEGQWLEAEKSLTSHANQSEAPLLNYLAAARAAHMRQAPARRDALLKKALQTDPKAHNAVAVAQAEMQLAANQLEQANATLVSLRKTAPKNNYVLKLLAKVLYKQENWEALLNLLPDLQKANLLNTDTMGKVKTATLQGLFNKYTDLKQPEKLQALWKQLPQPIREQPEAISLFAKALYQAGSHEQAAQFIQTTQQKIWHPELAELYGRLNHSNLNTAIQQAEKWLTQQPTNPNNLLLLARLHKQQTLWGVSKSYYEASLNQAPNREGYLELAELLETMGEKENAEYCYRLGLRYCILGKAERLTLLAAQRPKKKQEPNPVPVPLF